MNKHKVQYPIINNSTTKCYLCQSTVRMPIGRMSHRKGCWLSVLPAWWECVWGVWGGRNNCPLVPSQLVPFKRSVCWSTCALTLLVYIPWQECTFGFVTHLFSHELNRELIAGVAQGNMCRVTPPSILTKGSATEVSTEPTTFVQDFQVNGV